MVKHSLLVSEQKQTSWHEEPRPLGWRRPNFDNIPAEGTHSCRLLWPEKGLEGWSRQVVKETWKPKLSLDEGDPLQRNSRPLGDGEQKLWKMIVSVAIKK